jgi:transcriptional regulator with XRE-family HTH domain
VQLPPDEVAARIKAARELRRMSQQELTKRLAGAGLPVRLAGQLERGKAPLQMAAQLALARILGVPERWFTDPLEDILDDVGDPPPGNSETELLHLAPPRRPRRLRE